MAKWTGMAEDPDPPAPVDALVQDIRSGPNTYGHRFLTTSGRAGRAGGIGLDAILRGARWRLAIGSRSLILSSWSGAPNVSNAA